MLLWLENMTTVVQGVPVLSGWERENIVSSKNQNYYRPARLGVVNIANQVPGLCLLQLLNFSTVLRFCEYLWLQSNRRDFRARGGIYSIYLLYFLEAWMCNVPPGSIVGLPIIASIVHIVFLPISCICENYASVGVYYEIIRDLHNLNWNMYNFTSKANLQNLPHIFLPILLICYSDWGAGHGAWRFGCVLHEYHFNGSSMNT